MIIRNYHSTIIKFLQRRFISTLCPRVTEAQAGSVTEINLQRGLKQTGRTSKNTLRGNESAQHNTASLIHKLLCSKLLSRDAEVILNANEG